MADATVQAIIVQCDVQLHGDLRRVMAVVKIRNSLHSRTLRLFDITDAGISIGEPASDMQALLSGHPQPATAAPQPPGSAA